MISITVLAQGFQCASADITSAKIAIQQKEWPKAKASLEKELKKNPSNGEAWYFLGTVHNELNDLPGMIDAFAEAKKYVKREDYLENIKRMEYNAWVKSYNDAISQLNQMNGASDTEKRELADKSLANSKMAIRLRPENIDVYSVISLVHENIEENDKAANALEKYVTSLEPVASLLADKGVLFEMSRTDAMSGFGAPDNTKGLSYGDKVDDSVTVDIYSNLGGKEAYVFYPANSKGEFQLAAIRLSPPAGWLESEKMRFAATETSAWIRLAYHYYTKENYKKASKYLAELVKVKAPSEDAQRLQVQLLEKSGNADEALNSLKNLAEKFPDNPAYTTQYGSMLANSDRYDEAIAQYEKALRIDPKFEIALYNIAAAFKNKAGEIQEAESAKVDADEKYVPKDDLYLPFLRKSSDYFEQYRRLPGKKTETGVVEQLMNIYKVLREDDKFKRVVTEFKKMEALNLENPSYYEALGKIYAEEQNAQESQAAFDKADALRKKQR